MANVSVQTNDVPFVENAIDVGLVSLSAATSAYALTGSARAAFWAGGSALVGSTVGRAMIGRPGSGMAMGAAAATGATIAVATNTPELGVAVSALAGMTAGTPIDITGINEIGDRMYSSATRWITGGVLALSTIALHPDMNASFTISETNKEWRTNEGKLTRPVPNEVAEARGWTIQPI